MSRLHFGISVVVLAVMCFTQCRGDDAPTYAALTTPTTNIDPTFNCTVFGENQTSCCLHPSCAFVNCTFNATVSHQGCHNLNNTDDRNMAEKECGVNTTEIEEKNVCKAPETTCQDLNQTECCGPKGFLLSCVFINCTLSKEDGPKAMCMVDKNVSVMCEAGTNHTICAPDNSTTTTTPVPTTTTSQKTTTAPTNATTAAPTTLAPTTPKVITSTTAAPVTTQAPAKTTKTPPKPAPSKSGQHFDAASFIGGMILMGGLIVIIYFGLKFYRARRDRNYRTL